MAQQNVQRRLAAILAADVVGYSLLMGADEEGTLSRLKAHRNDLIGPKIEEHRGRLVKTTGDGMLVEFASVVDALRCATAIQRGMAERNRNEEEGKQIRLRVGINVGDIVVDGSDIYGDGVNVAARLEAIADPGGICISARVQEDARGKVDIAFEDLGEQQLKNIAWPVRVYRAQLDRETAIPRPTPAIPDKPSIVVLPFDNLSGDPEQQYFSDGIAEDVITDLSKISGLFVIARNSAFTYRGRAVRVPEVSRELGVRYVLEGSVRKAGSRVRIAAQLIDGATGGHLWAERYDRDLADIFAVQDEVTREIVSALAIRLTRSEQRRLKHRGTESLEAYDLYLRGRQLVWQANKAANEDARVLLERAIALDPRFASAYSTLASVHALDYSNRWRDPPEESLQAAYEMAQKAVALDDNSPEAHCALGVTYLSLKQPDRAMAEAQKALTLDLNFVWAHSVLGQALHYAGRSRDAIEPLRTAIQHDPIARDLYLHFLAQAHFGLEEYEEAAGLLKRRILRKPDTDLSRVLLAACYGHLGRADEARDLWAEVRRINPDYSLDYHRRINAYKDSSYFERLIDGLRKAGVSI